MNVIAADMCTNARRVRKRWLPKIQSLLPDSIPATTHTRKAKRGGAVTGGQSGDIPGGGSPFELDLRQLSASYLGLEVPLYERRDREAAGEREKEASAALLPHLQFATSRGGGGGGGEGGGAGGGRERGEEGPTGGAVDGEERLQTEQPPDLPLSLSSAASSSSSSHASPQPAETAPAHTASTTEERGVELLENSQ